MGVFRSLNPFAKAVSPLSDPVRTGQLFQHSWTNVPVTESTALGLPSVYSCLELIAGGISVMPIQAKRNGEVIKTPKLLENPYPEQARIETIFAIVQSLLLWGNFYALLGPDFDSLGYAQNFVPLHASQVNLMREADGGYFYWVTGAGTVKKYPPEEVLHIKGQTAPGQLHGFGILDFGREAIGQGLGLQEYASRWFSEGVSPQVSISVPGKLDKDGIDNMSDQIVAKHSNRDRRPLILTDGGTLNTYQISPKDSQFIETERANTVHIANLFRVPPHSLGVSTKDSMTYTNVEMEEINLQRNTLNNWCVRIEHALSQLLPRGTEAVIKRPETEADTATLYNALNIGVVGGWILPNEARAKVGLEALEEEQANPDAVQDQDALDVNGADDEQAAA